MKKFTKTFLVALISLLCSATAGAYDFVVDGIYYNILSQDNLTVEVTKGDNKYTGDIVIPSTVTYKSRTLSVTGIGRSAFYNCSSITSIIIPNSVTSIEDWAFEGCSSLAIIEIPNSVTSIGIYVFSDCSSLASIEIPNSVTNIKSGTFEKCSSLTSIEITDSVTSIESYAFSGCSSLTSIEIPNSVTSIGRSAFKGCNSLKYLYIEDGTTTLSLDCNEFSPTLTGEGLFHDCSLESLHLGRNLFYYTYPSNGYSPFAMIKSLNSVTIGDRVTSIGNNAFYDCSSISSIYMQGTTPPSVGSDNFTNKQHLEVTLYVPNGSIATYQSAETWKDFWEIKVYNPTGIDDISADDIETKFTGNGISVPNAVGKAVYVYSVNGAVLKKFAHYDGGEITLDNGTYIIRIGEKAIKVQL